MVIEKGEPANFFAYYEIDDDESKHNLQLAEHGCPMRGCCLRRRERQCA